MSAYADNNIDVVELVREIGTPLLWKPRLSDAVNIDYGLLSGGDLHSVGATPRCPVCFNATLQRPASTICTTCFGTGWQGGFAATQFLAGIVTTGTLRVRLEETGNLIAVEGVWLGAVPADGLLLPQDLIVQQSNTNVRYLIGEIATYQGFLDTPALRTTQLLPQAPDSPWHGVPL